MKRSFFIHFLNHSRRWRRVAEAPELGSRGPRVAHKTGRKHRASDASFPRHPFSALGGKGSHLPFPPLHTWQDKITDTTSVWNLGISMCFEKHTVNVCIHQGGANMIRRSKGMLPFVPFGPFHKIAFNFCDITMRPWPFAVPQA